jgi:hypothetical protein
LLCRSTAGLRHRSYVVQRTLPGNGNKRSPRFVFASVAELLLADVMLDGDTLSIKSPLLQHPKFPFRRLAFDRFLVYGTGGAAMVMCGRTSPTIPSPAQSKLDTRLWARDPFAS